MSDPAALRALAARVETEVGNRALDVEIWDEGIGLTDAEEQHCRIWCGMDRRTDLTREMFLHAWAPRYTTDLTAAASAMPEGWWVWHIAHGSELWSVVLGWRDAKVAKGHAPTEPRARVAATLRARAADLEAGG